MSGLNILIATSEATPLAKTGGLADVCGALPAALAKHGARPVVIMPAYRSVLERGRAMEPTDVTFDIPIGGKIVTGSLWKSKLTNGDIPLYLVRQDDYFDRDGLYGEHGNDYQDNCERFVFFSRAVLESIRLLGLPVDILHCNDWQTSLALAYLEIEYRGAHGYEDIAGLLTIHNMAYQGVFWHWDMLLTGIDWKYFNWRQMEFYGQLNLLKTGLVFADAINTVSPTYAREIQEAPWGCGLEGLLRQRSDVTTGIINGVDYAIWDPAIDDHLPVKYDTTSWKEGKQAARKALQDEFGLPPQSNAPLLGLVGRLAEQKGWDLITELMQRWLPEEDAQWVILGTGDSKYHRILGELAARFPQKLGLRLEFSDGLAHRIEAGADMFIMPSRYEPCGLNQLYSLKYGTPPVVRNTGGLSDTIADATPENLHNGVANGFRFEHDDVHELEHALQRAFHLWRNQPETWAQIVNAGMRQDWSWGRSAQRYIALYEKTRARRAEQRLQLEN